MKKLKVNFWLQKHRKLLLLVMLFVALYMTIVGMTKMDFCTLTENAGLFGVVGTLLGAFIGGVFSLMGSVWVNNKQQKAAQNIKRKNIIYSPLYDELINIQNNILEQNPFPWYLTLWMMDNYEVQSVTGASFHKLSDQTDQGNAFGNWDPDKFCVEDSAFGFIRMKNGAVIELESAWALNTLEVDEAKTSLCGTKAGADMKDGLRINYIHHNTQVVEKPELSSGGVAFFSGKEKSAADYEQELFYHIVVDGAEQVVKPAQAAVVTRILEAIYQSAESGKTIYFE